MASAAPARLPAGDRPAPAAPAAPPWRRPLLLTVAGALAEAVALRLAGLAPALGIAPGLTAGPALGAFHDVRWIFVFDRSWPMLAGEALGALACRSLLLTALVRAAWPRGVPVPALRRVVRRAAVFSVVMLALQSWAATLTFAAGAFPVGWILLAGFVPAAALALLAGHTVVCGRPWWRPPPAAAVGWAALGVVALTVGGAAISVTPGWLALLPVAATGVANAAVWRGIVAAVVAPAHRAPRPRLTAPAALTAAGIVAVCVALVVSSAATPSRLPPLAAGPTGGATVPVLFVSGWRSTWHGGDPTLGPGFREVRFSYRGLNAARRPLPYDAADTYRSLPTLASLMRQQVSALTRRFGGQRVVIVASSEGTLVTQTYLQSTADPPVRAVLDFSPILQPGRVSYPLAGRDGWGRAAAAEMGGVMDILDDIGFGSLSPNTPLLRSIVRLAPTLSPGMACPSRVPQADLIDVQSATATLPAPLPRVPSVVIPAIHGVISTPSMITRVLDATLHGHQLRTAAVSTLGYQLLRGASSAWQVPPLPQQWPVAGRSTVSGRRSASRATTRRTTSTPCLVSAR